MLDWEGECAVHTEDQEQAIIGRTHVHCINFNCNMKLIAFNILIINIFPCEPRNRASDRL